MWVQATDEAMAATLKEGERLVAAMGKLTPQQQQAKQDRAALVRAEWVAGQPSRDAERAATNQVLAPLHAWLAAQKARS